MEDDTNPGLNLVSLPYSWASLTNGCQLIIETHGCQHRSITPSPLSAWVNKPAHPLYYSLPYFLFHTVSVQPLISHKSLPYRIKNKQF